MCKFYECMFDIDFGKRFACVADAVVYLVRHGFETVDSDADSRLMAHPDGRGAFLHHEALLDVSIAPC